jgi:hypothetical protein
MNDIYRLRTMDLKIFEWELLCENQPNSNNIGCPETRSGMAGDCALSANNEI